MIDGSEKRNRQLAFELQNSHVCEKRSKQEKRPHIQNLKKNQQGESSSNKGGWDGILFQEEKNMKCYFAERGAKKQASTVLVIAGI